MLSRAQQVPIYHKPSGKGVSYVSVATITLRSETTVNEPDRSRKSAFPVIAARSLATLVAPVAVAARNQIPTPVCTFTRHLLCPHSESFDETIR